MRRLRILSTALPARGLPGNDAVAEQRFDIQHTMRRSAIGLPANAMLLFNQRCARLQSLEFAARHGVFPSSTTTGYQLGAAGTKANIIWAWLCSPLTRLSGLQNSSKETLRLDPHNTAAKFNLERLYQFCPQTLHRSGRGLAGIALARLKTKTRGARWHGRSGALKACRGFRNAICALPTSTPCGCSS